MSTIKPVLVIFSGDWHVGSTTGLCVPGHYTGEGKDRRRISLSGNQEWLWHQFTTQFKRVKAMARNHRLYVLFGSETIDGPLHHGTTQTWGDRAEQREMARDVLRLWLEMADEALAVTGTESHVGSEGEDDADVYRTCGVPHRQFWNSVIGGKRLWWSHQGVRVGARAWTENNAMKLLATDLYYHCLSQKMDAPNLVVSHHVHRAPDPVTANGITVAVCPAWQLSTYYGGTISPYKPTDIGNLIWKPETNEVEVMRARTDA